MSRSRTLLLAAAVTLTAGGAAAPASAATFSCKANALQVLSLPSNIGAGGSPCSAGFKYVASNATGPLRNNLVRAGGLMAFTIRDNGTRAVAARAAAGDVTVDLGALKLRAELLTADAVASCSSGLSTDGAIGRLTLNGTKIVSAEAPLSLPLGLATVHVNHVERTATSVRRRALWVQTPLGDVTVADASAGMSAC